MWNCIMKIIQQIYDKYGFDAMREIWIEELLELACALQQAKRKPIGQEHIITEIADVDFIIEQMKHIYGVDKCNEEKAFKVLRTKEELL